MLKKNGLRLPEDKLTAPSGGRRGGATTKDAQDKSGGRRKVSPPVTTPSTARYLLDSAWVAFDKGDYVRSEQIYGQPELRGERSAYLGLGASLDMQGRFEEALEPTRNFIRLTEAIGVTDDLHKAYANLANSLLSLGRRDEARIAIDLALRIEPDDRVALEISRQIGPAERQQAPRAGGKG